MADNYLTQQEYQNPDATAPLIVPVLVMANTPAAQIEKNIRTNTALPLEWLCQKDEHGGTAVLVGGGPSAADHIDDIRLLQEDGATVFAMNGASKWLRKHGVIPDYQVIVDAKETTTILVDPEAKAHLFASQVHPKVMLSAPAPIVWHMGTEGVEDLFPPERVKAGGYALLGGGAAVGTCALCIAYTLGFRKLEVFGYDSSNRKGNTHAYRQEMNRFIPNVDVEWAGKTYNASVAMKAHAEWFLIIARGLLQMGCSVTVHGTGLLPAMWNTKAEDLTERDKYRLLWQTDLYRNYAPGEAMVPFVVSRVKPDTIIDFGCGTGRAGVALAKAGFDVRMVDFANNCRDKEAQGLPFLDWDMTRPGMPLRASYGLCTDVMEHIPPDDVDKVIRNIMAAVDTCFFQISTVPDTCGSLIGTPLHLSVHDAGWWRDKFTSLGFTAEWALSGLDGARFVVSRTPSDGRKSA